MPPRRKRNQRTEEPVNKAGGQPDPTQNLTNMNAQAMQNGLPTAGNQPDNRSANFEDFKTNEPSGFRGPTNPVEVVVIARVTEGQKKLLPPIQRQEG